MKRAGFTLVEVLCVIAIFAIIVLALAPVVQITKDRAHKINCANNLRILSLALHGYAADHNGSFPKTLHELYPGYVKDQAVFNCPASKHAGTPEDPDYAYVDGLTEEVSAWETVLYDLDGNHNGHRKNVLRLNGSVEWVQAEGKPK
jgi:prepilin-type N-terminal cleavage/methylation domain-containing protein